MQTVQFSGCFGWLHTDKTKNQSDLAVVLCAGFHMDMMAGYRQLRLLAEALAVAGVPTLRFHYPGTGNSVALKSANGWTEWQDSIHSAIDHLRGWTGAKRIILVGLRLGALLAASMANQRSDLAALILLAPVFRGRTFVLQLDVEQKTALAHVSGNRPPLFPTETLRQISQQSLAAFPVPSDCAVAVYAKSESAALKECQRRWEKAGVTTSFSEFTGLEPLLRPTFMNHERPIVTDVLVTRILSFRPIHTPGQLASPPSAVISTSAWTETPRSFGPNGALFGILCNPTHVVDEKLIVLLANSGGDAHCAAAGVEVARRLAEIGIASYRFDFAGIGDSQTQTDIPTHVFEVDRTADFSAAIDMTSDLTYTRFAAYGICSGAYHAYLAAQSDPRLGSIFMINIPCLHWEPSQLVEALDIRATLPTRIAQDFMTRDAWLTALHDGRGLREHCVRYMRWIVKQALAWRDKFRRRPPATTSEKGNILTLAKRTRLLYLFSENDPGLAVILEALGSEQRSSASYVEASRELDHAVSDSAMQRLVAERLARFLQIEVRASKAA